MTKSMVSTFHTFMVFVSVLLLAFGSLGVTPAYAAASTWYVAPTGNDSNPCSDAGSPCLTINGALGKAADGDVINVAMGTYTGTGVAVVTINKAITISGGWDAGFTTQSGLSIIDAEAARRGIATSNNTVVLDRFQIQNGHVGALGGSGAGIVNQDGNLTINNSIIRANLLGDWCCGGGNGGAGINNWGNGEITLNNTTVSNNTILGGYLGSGIHNGGLSVTLNNSTVSGNVGSEGIYNSSGILTINNGTITQNQDMGIRNVGGEISLQNTIIALNGPEADCINAEGYDGTVTSYGYNLIGNGTGCTFTPTTGDQVGTSFYPINARLGPLQDNGGPTLTHALLSGSPAFDTGNPVLPGSGGSACLATDQRGITRPMESACDIGAYEVNIPFTIPAAVSPARSIMDSTPTYTWNKIQGATQYQYQLFKGTKLVYAKTAAATVCGVLLCSNTPGTTLGLGDYKWKIRALVGGVWTSYSPFTLFKLLPAKAGFWKSAGLEFYVVPEGTKVDNFAIYIYVYGCGNYKVVRDRLTTIGAKSGRFAFTGSFYVTGTFQSAASVAGTLGLSRYYLSGCGYVSGGPFSWTAKWRNSNQPVSEGGDIEEFTVEVAQDADFFFEVDAEP